MGSKKKDLKEQLQFLEPEFAKHGVTYEIRRVDSATHRILSFVVNGVPKALTVAGSTDRMARLRNRTILRALLEGREW